MKILVIGGGGREHAIVWRLRQSPSVKKIWCAPGNGGIAQDAECLAADTGDVTGLAQLASRLGADLTVVGPEQPLVLGIADEFARQGLRLVGPSKKSAQLEGSKVFAKEFLNRHAIPTARMYGVYDSPRSAREGLRNVEWPLVLKADGLCAGKGVLVTKSAEEAESFIERVQERGELGEGGARIMMEEALTGQELSYIVLTDGDHVAPLVPTRDHKRAYDGDQGPNTGGMGAYSSNEIVSGELERRILDSIVNPTFVALRGEGHQYRGFLYFGLMLTPAGPLVLEFNCRLGDPETQALIPRMDFDLVEALSATADGRLGDVRLAWKPQASVSVVMASGGYPGAFETGKRIDGLAEAAAVPGATVFHASTKLGNDGHYTSGGRVLAVSALGQTVEAARKTAYQAVGHIRFAGAHYRRDIAEKAGSVMKAARD